MKFDSFDEFFNAATGHDPYPHQAEVAEQGLPELLQADTGTGKTEAMILGWLWRRRFHPEAGVHAATPRKLVFALPMRVLVEQTASRVTKMLEKLGIQDKVHSHMVLGGLTGADRGWQDDPSTDTIFIGTIDMLLSRALNRGYAASRWTWPMSFGVFNNDVHWVFDEIQLLEAALPTSLQLQAFRDQMGTIGSSSSTWMSATVDTKRLDTVDRAWDPSPEKVVQIDREQVSQGSALGKRLLATKTVTELHIDATDTKALAAILLDEHRPGTATLAVCNTVDRAKELQKQLNRLTTAQAKKDEQSVPEVLLMHSRFRPPDRALATTNVQIAMDNPKAEGVIVVSTQVLEAGVDISATTLFTEAAPWASIVQRAGRCNREGNDDNARLLWADVPPKKTAPYDPGSLERAAKTLRDLEGRSVDSPKLSQKDPEVNELPPVLPVLRRRDLHELFDTGSDLSGNDIDVGRFIRSDEERGISVFWRIVNKDGITNEALPNRNELCGVPIGDLKKFVKKYPDVAHVLDPLNRSRRETNWVRARSNNLTPGSVVMLDASIGGYTKERGWDPTSKAHVSVIETPSENVHVADGDIATGDDSASTGIAAVTLEDHLAHVAQEAENLTSTLLAGEPNFTVASIEAAKLHDLGKAHVAFQTALYSLDLSAEERRDKDVQAELGPLLAKSGRNGRLIFMKDQVRRKHFRHELVSLLIVENQPGLVSASNSDLVRYLILAHHGRARLSIRQLEGDEVLSKEIDSLVTLGVIDGEKMMGFKIEVSGDTLEVEALKLDLATLMFGDDLQRGWSDRALDLQHDPELGPFRLGYLEMLVRLADWHASAKEKAGGYS